MKIYIETHGCKRRTLDSSKFIHYFAANNYTVVNNPANADYILLITCAFKQEEEEKSLARLNTLKNYNARLLVYGCLPAISPHKLFHQPNIHYLTTKDIDRIDYYFEDIKTNFSSINDANLIDKSLYTISARGASQKFLSHFEFSEKFFIKLNGFFEKKIKAVSRPPFNLLISRGCLGDCSYCAIKFAIGSIKSKPEHSIFQELQGGIRAGHKKFTILADDSGAYGLDIKSSFPDLLSRLIDKSNGSSHQTHKKTKEDNGIRFFIDELHPKWMVRYEEQLLEIITTGKIEGIMCPIESGSNRILKLMKRYHCVTDIKTILSKITRTAPQIELSTQIIAGFPSETDEEFNETLNFLKESPFKAVTVFPYHDKENTESIKLGNKVPDEVIDQRIRKAINFLRKDKIKVYLSCPL